jgi:non-heme chloroperoxidase
MVESARTPVVFVPGLWLHALSWSNWVELFREAGYDPIAPEWPGIAATVERARADPRPMAGNGVAEVVEHYAGIIRSLPAKPIVVGHSFGGVVAQILLGRGLAAAAVAIDAAPVQGVLTLPFSALKVAFVALKNPANRRRAVSLTREEFRYGFANAVSESEAEELYDRWTIPAPGRPLFQAAFANFTPGAATKAATRNATRGPLLLIAGEKDNTVPPAITRSTARLYRSSPAVTDLKVIPGRGHSLTVDSGWREVAETALGWLREQNL